MTRFGIDYAWHSTLDPAALKNAGVTFVCRYYFGGDDSKLLHLGEAQDLSTAGIDIVTVWESTADRANAGAGAGAADGAAAVVRAQQAWQPTGSAIYFAVDFDTTVGPLITAYGRAFSATCHAAGYRSGIYGSFTVVEQALLAGICDLGWQTYAWSGGRVSSRAALLQYSNSHFIAGVDCEVDYDRSLADDFGQWRIGGTQPYPIDTEDPVASLLEMDLNQNATQLGWYANRLDVVQLMLSKAGELVVPFEGLVQPPRSPDVRLDNLRKALDDFQAKTGTGSGNDGKTPDRIVGPKTAKALCELKKVT